MMTRISDRDPDKDMAAKFNGRRREGPVRGHGSQRPDGEQSLGFPSPSLTVSWLLPLSERGITGLWVSRGTSDRDINAFYIPGFSTTTFPLLVPDLGYRD